MKKNAIEQNNVLLSDDELKQVSGGATQGGVSYYGRPCCPGPERCTLLRCGDCYHLSIGPEHKVGNVTTSFWCTHP